MANATSMADIHIEDLGFNARQDVASGVTILENAMVNVDSTGYAVNATDSADDVCCIGPSACYVNNSAGVDGAEIVDTLLGKISDMGFEGTYAAATCMMQKCYVYDDHTVALAATTTNDVLAGYIIGPAVSISGGVRVLWLPIPLA